ncbi:MAG TPA: NAD(P)-binding protein [Blastocatellia bacterium]|nr:NAD(P)-binding protein [Blastocatellia bacterium]
MRVQLTRREMLATFLGLPAAIAACRSNQTPPLPRGEIVGASDGIGHKIRDGFRPSPQEGDWQRTGVVIVGGGVSGLSAAWRLLKSGFEDFVLLELEMAPGGTARSGDSPLVPYPWGAHYIPAPMKENPWLIELLGEMGLLEGHDDEGQPRVAEQFICRDPEERIFYKGRWYEGLYLHAGATSEDEAQLRSFHQEIDRWVAWRDSKGRRAFAIPVAMGSDDADVTALDKLTMSEWMDIHQFRSPRLRWLVDYACRDDYGARMEDVSAWAGIFYFASRVTRPGEEARPLVTWPEGNGHLVSHLYNKVKAKVRLGLAVTDIIPSLINAGNPAGRETAPPSQKSTESARIPAPQIGIDVTAIDSKGQTAYGFRANKVIFAAPHFLSRHLIRSYRENPPAHVTEFEYGAWMVANLFLKSRPETRGFPLAWDNVLYESPSLGYVVATHQRGLDRGPSIFTYYYPLVEQDPRQARQRLLGAGWAEWADVALADLERAHQDIRTLTERLDLMRWGHAMIRPRPGFIWGAARRAAAAPYKGIHFANTDLSGVALFEEAFYHGIRAAEEVMSGK